jgi:very-short-patch-repair endonuclease
VPVCADRKWRWDFFLPDHRIVIEVDGYFKGRHGAGWGSDNEKANHGTMAGVRVLRFSTKDVETGKAKAFLSVWL